MPSLNGRQAGPGNAVTSVVRDAESGVIAQEVTVRFMCALWLTELETTSILMV
jgi:hypothetical protein